MQGVCLYWMKVLQVACGWFTVSFICDALETVWSCCKAYFIKYHNKCIFFCFLLRNRLRFTFWETGLSYFLFYSWYILNDPDKPDSLFFAVPFRFCLLLIYFFLIGWARASRHNSFNRSRCYPLLDRFYCTSRFLLLKSTT